LRNVIESCSIDVPSNLFEEMLHSYRLCDSSPCVFDSLFKTFAHMKKFRDATDTFCQMKDYGFFPTIESSNAYMSSLLDLHRMDITLAFYGEMRCHRILPKYSCLGVRFQ
jgi:pentatricopeptide repeat protein